MEEIIRTLVGSTTLVFAVPLTTALMAYVLGRWPQRQVLKSCYTSAMNNQQFSRLKPIIAAIIVLGVLSAGVLSLQIMDHGAMTHHGCAGLTAGAPPCLNLVDLASCLQVQMQALRAVAQAVPTQLSQLFFVLAVVAMLWFWSRRRQGEPEALSRLRWRWQDFTSGSYPVVDKIWQWLTLHEKRDPAAAGLAVLGVLPVRVI